MWSEINDIFDAVLGNEVEKILCLITVRVEEGEAFAIVNILYHQVMKEGCLANSCLPTHIHVSGDVGLY
jgi:hypothetical protein